MMAGHPSSSAMTPNASFPQSGSWNMFDIMKLPVNTTLGALSRYRYGFSGSGLPSFVL
jgi:hypothetical protein